MENVTYVTGNYGKYVSVKEKLEKLGIEINYSNIDIDEPNINDIELISREKARIAYENIKSPVFVVDCGFYIRSYPNCSYYPGAFVKRSGVASDVNKLLVDMSKVEDRYCYFLDCLTYYDGENFISFYGKSEGNLSIEVRGDKIKKAMSNLWFVFIPNNCNKTLAEMSDYERNNRNDGRTDATVDFVNWLKKELIENNGKEETIKILSK